MDSNVRALPHSELNTPEVRMLTALLATCDVYGWVEEGNPPAAYTHTAWAVLLRLQAGLGADEVAEVLGPSVDSTAARRFAWAALEWWAGNASAKGRGNTSSGIA